MKLVTSLTINALFACSRTLASLAFAVGSTAGVGKVSGSAAASVLTTPLFKISTTSSNAAVVLVSAVTSASTAGRASVSALAKLIAFVVCANCSAVTTSAFAR